MDLCLLISPEQCYPKSIESCFPTPCHHCTGRYGGDYAPLRLFCYSTGGRWQVACLPPGALCVWGLQGGGTPGGAIHQPTPVLKRGEVCEWRPCENVPGTFALVRTTGQRDVLPLVLAWSLCRGDFGGLWRCCGPLFQLMAHWRPFEAF